MRGARLHDDGLLGLGRRRRRRWRGCRRGSLLRDGRLSLLRPAATQCAQVERLGHGHAHAQLLGAPVRVLVVALHVHDERAREGLEAGGARRAAHAAEHLERLCRSRLGQARLRRERAEAAARHGAEPAPSRLLRKGQDRAGYSWRAAKTFLLE
eukprot:5031001-Pleurochrysis_carterae.AAC.1